MDVIKQAEKIMYCSNQVIELMEGLEEAGEARAAAECDYDKEMGKVVATMDEDRKYRSAAVKDIAKGKCADLRATAIIAETNYKSLITKIEGHKAVMNAQQSIFRHLDAT